MNVFISRFKFSPQSAALIFALIFCSPSFAASDPYSVDVWANVLFSVEGTVTQFDVVSEANYPAAFLANVKARIAKAKIPPRLVDGKAVTFRSGMQMGFLITPDEKGGQVKMTGLALDPLPLKKYYAESPRDIRGDGWEGAVEAVCTIGIDGKCKTIVVTALPGMPESIRRHAKVSLEGWRFAPQEVDGHPIEGEYIMRMNLHNQQVGPSDFRQEPFQRLQQGR